MQSPLLFLNTKRTPFLELKQGNKGVLKSLKDDGTFEKILKEKKWDLKKEADLISLIIVIDRM